MTNTEPTPDQPLDDHHEEDYFNATDSRAKERPDFSPGQINAGQQLEA